MGNPVTHFEIASKEGERLAEFYRSLFDWEIHRFDWKIIPFAKGIYGVIASPTHGLKGHIFPTTDDMDFSNHVTIYILVEDLHATLEKIESYGGKILILPQEIPDNRGMLAMFLDPGGNVIGLHQQ
ncbi:MAG: VOC family protein [Candidatus Poribacteria bacterium]|nr:VOC family protein [Candidatus Poribacteria bacterium]